MALNLACYDAPTEHNTEFAWLDLALKYLKIHKENGVWESKEVEYPLYMRTPLFLV